MKRIIVISLLAVFGSLGNSRSQGFVFFSNLSEVGSGFSVGGGSQAFLTGSASNGYSLNSITLLMGGALDIASNFSVSIFNDNGGTPGNSLETLNGNDDPRTSGAYLYIASGLSLLPNTTFWIVATCESSSVSPIMPPGGYTWQQTLSQTATTSGGWSAGPNNAGFPGALFQFEINASPVQTPEPSELGLLGVAVAVFLCNKRGMHG